MTDSVQKWLDRPDLTETEYEQWLANYDLGDLEDIRENLDKDARQNSEDVKDWPWCCAQSTILMFLDQIDSPYWTQVWARHRKENLISEIRSYAKEHYEEKGWDFIVECFGDEEIWEEIKTCKTRLGAIRKISSVVSILDENRREIAATAF